MDGGPGPVSAIFTRLTAAPHHLALGTAAAVRAAALLTGPGQGPRVFADILNNV